MTTQAFARQKLDSRIAELERKLALLKNIREANESPDLSEELAFFFDANGQPENPESADAVALKRPRSESFGKIEAYFHARNNEPATREDVIAGTGLGRSAVTQVMYVSHQPFFSRSKPDMRPGGKCSLFSLKAK